MGDSTLRRHPPPICPHPNRDAGLLLSLLTILCWGTLPLLLQPLLQSLSILTITWIEFTGAFCLLGLYRTAQLKRSPWQAIRKIRRWSIIVTTLLFTAYYLLYLKGLQLATPAVAQVVMQTAPMFIAVGASIFYSLPITQRQQSYLAFLLVGLGLFSAPAQRQFWEDSDPIGLIGLAVLIGSALTYSLYALTQQQILRKNIVRAEEMTLILCGGAALLLTPLAQLNQFPTLSSTSVLLLLACCANTLVSFSAFNKSLEHWSATQTGAVVVFNPFVTLAAEGILSRYLPQQFSPPQIEPLQAVGVILILIAAVGITCSTSVAPTT